MRDDARAPTAFVFAGGGSLGAAEVGMLRALHQSGVRADLAVGSSVGALNAVHYAGDPTLAGIARLERIWRRVKRSQVFPSRPTRGLRALFGLGSSVMSPLPLRRLIEQEIRHERLEDTAMPCHVVATDVLSGAEVVLSSGPAVDALLASAIPGVFPPVEIAGNTLVDGGIAGNTPIAAAASLGAGRVVVLPAGFSCGVSEAPRDAMGITVQALNIMIARQLVRDIERLRGQLEIVVVPPICPLARSPYDFTGTAELIELAARSTRAWLEAGGFRSGLVPPSLRPELRLGAGPYAAIPRAEVAS